MTRFEGRVQPGWQQHLKTLLETAKLAGPKGLLIFDLDSTIFDNRPRQSRIVREFGKVAGLSALEKCTDDNWTSGWDLKAALVSCGLSEQSAEQNFKAAKNFWGARFFTSAYCADDIEVPGAPQYLHSVVKTGAQIVYVTGRHEEMRAGSIECMKKCGMPVPGAAVTLLMKPTLRESDDTYKVQTHAKLAGMGTVVAAFDNEPTHANDYAKKFTAATVIHLATDHSGRPVELLPQVISVPDFRI